MENGMYWKDAFLIVTVGSKFFPTPAAFKVLYPKIELHSGILLNVKIIFQKNAYSHQLLDYGAKIRCDLINGFAFAWNVIGEVPTV